MTDTAALYGLVGAIGGALLGAGAAVAAPLLQNRGTERAHLRARREAEVNRLIKIRSSTRRVLELQSDTIEALAAGRQVSPQELSVSMAASLQEAWDAADMILTDGFFAPISRSSYEAVRPRPDLGRRRVSVGLRLDQQQVFRAMKSLGTSICIAAESGPGPVPPETISHLRAMFADVERTRSELVSHLLDRIDWLM